MKVAINGFGRIGRLTARVLLESFPEVHIVAINDLTNSANLAYLFEYDSTYRKFAGKVEYDEHNLKITSNKSTQIIKVYSEKDPALLPWRELEIDVVIECTGFFRTEELASKHVLAGAKKVILSAPGKSSHIPTIVRGVTTAIVDQTIVSNASCTTNCVAPVLEILERYIGIDQAWGLTVHAYTASQMLQDGPSLKEFRDGRAAAQNMIPTSTGSDSAIVEVIPTLTGKVHMSSLRVPIITGSMVYLTISLSKNPALEELKSLFVHEAQSDRYKGILELNASPLVSSDIIHNPASVVVAEDLLEVVGKTAKLVLWYDNEWGYANRLAELVVQSLDKKL
jgi:glyceraldehyde 3-phosphate dehydrogenase